MLHVRGMPKRAAIYVRVSSARQNAVAQHRELQALAASRGLDVVAVFDETHSTLGRGKRAGGHGPKFKEVMKLAHRGAIDVLLVWAVDRIARSTAEVFSLVQTLDACRVVIVSAREPWLTAEGPMRGLLLAVAGFIAEFERERLMERTAAAVETARLAGKHIGRPRSRKDFSKAEEMILTGRSAKSVAAELGIPLTTLRRRLAKTPPSGAPISLEGNGPLLPP